MKENQISTGSNNGEVLAMLNPAKESKKLYQIAGINEYIQYIQSPLVANQAYLWEIDDDFQPLVLWIGESSLQNNKNIQFAITQNGNTQWKVTLTQANFLAVGSASYWVFPITTIAENSIAYFKSDVALNSMLVIGKQCHVQKNISGAISSTFPA